jgi:SAM-dependent methyltransferase
MTTSGPRKQSTDDLNGGLPFWDPRKVLEYPPIYNFFQNAVGADKPRRRFIEEHITPLGRARVLEVGCGPGTNCAWMPEGVEYVGCDLNAAYIEYARERYTGRGEFYVAGVGELAALELRPFKAIYALAVLHHLSDAEVLTLCDEVLALLEPRGMLITGDPCFFDGQGRIEHFITSCDRGHFVRHPEQYRDLLAQRFPRVELQVNHIKGMLIPNTGVLLKAHAS